MTMISSRHSGLTSLPSDHTHVNNHRSANNVRRQSRLLYAEKYGLNSPEWQNSTTLGTLDKGNDKDHSSVTGASTPTTDDDEEDDRPLSLQPRSYSYSAALSPSRPRSIFNLSEPSAATTRPTAFVKPITATASGSPPCTVPSDMISIQQLYEHYQNKVYMEGFIFKRNKCNSYGSSCQDQWTKLYVELSGPILSLWDGRKLDNTSSPSATILPHFINISDATATLVNNKDNSAMIILNTAGRNQYLIRPDPPTLSTAQRWVIAIRLSCFEGARLFGIYSRRLLLRPTYNNLLNPSSTTKRRIEGFIQARFAGDTEWKKYWAVVSDQRDQKRLFGKSKSVPCRGQFMFYESKKSKYPLVTLVNVVHAYTLYPQSPQLIDLATIFKVEGTTLTTTDIKTGEQNMTHTSAGTLLMAPSAKDMMQWLIGTFDVFKLYGRPSSLLDNPLDPKSLNFGETTSMDDSHRLFLEYSDVMHLPIGQDETLLDSKMAFTAMLTQKLGTGSSNSPVNPIKYTAKSRSNSAPLLANIAPPADYTMNTHTQSNPASTTSIATIPNRSIQPATQRASMMIRRQSQGAPMVYASDGSDEEDDENDNDSDDDSDDNNSDTLSEFIATKGLTNLAYGEKELQSLPESSISSPTTSTTDSNKVLSLKNEHQDNNTTTTADATDMMGFANDLLSKTFDAESTNTPKTTTSNKQMVPPIDTTSLRPSPSQNALSSSSSDNISPMHATVSRTATIIDSTTPPTSATSVEKPPLTKRMSVLPLPSDDEDEDSGSKTTADDDDESPIHCLPLNNKMMTSTSSFSSMRPLSTIQSTATTPTMLTSTRSSAATSSDGSSSNTSTSSQNHYQHHRKPKRQSVLAQQPPSNPRPSSSIGLVHKIDNMQQQIQLQQQQQQLEKEQQSLWETGSLMGTDPRIASYQYRPNQQPQQQQHQQQQTWDTRSMTGSMTGPDPRIAMYRQAGSMYGGGSAYGNVNDGIGSSGSFYGANDNGAGDSVYSGGDDYQKMMMMSGQPLVQLENKPSEPRSGLVGVISQMEDEKRESENNSNHRFSTSSFSPPPQQYQDQVLYQQQLLQQQHQVIKRRNVKRKKKNENGTDDCFIIVIR
ncbi:hypothetical protein BCR42DRAFT_152342 [Absidia repens]|uniref:PH domain-containing protein n=1 Tax=Absidia repens TaxID=90262 RepID=A0A1X2I3P5_9FUNG|nr:hypothetical protein BCR42DRAFT_152342 [Absidia repens]